MTHAHFLLMGGFMLYDGDQPIGTLSMEKFAHLLEKGLIRFPTVTEREIKDRSKADPLAKALVMLQILWFFGKSIGRTSLGMRVTRLELFTLIMTSYNVLIHLSWWHKPVNVDCPIPVHLQSLPYPGRCVERHPKTNYTLDLSLPLPTLNTFAMRIRQCHDCVIQSPPTLPVDPENRASPFHRYPHGNTSNLVPPGVKESQDLLWNTFDFIQLSPFLSLIGLVGSSSTEVRDRSSRVHTYYSPFIMLEPSLIPASEPRMAASFCLSMVIGSHMAWVLFDTEMSDGTIHSKTLGIVSTLISVAPVSLIFITLTLTGSDRRKINRCKTSMTFYLYVFATLLYVLARLLVLLLSCVTLAWISSDLDTYQDIDWAYILPHFCKSGTVQGLTISLSVCK